MIPRFRMVRINLNQFAILADKLPDTTNVNISLSFLYSLKAKRIAGVINVNILNPEGNLVIKMELNCEFEFHNEDWPSFIRESKFVVSPEVLRYLGSQAVGVARGVLFCKTEGTPFASIVLPPVNVAEMIKEGINEPLND